MASSPTHGLPVLGSRNISPPCRKVIVFWRFSAFRAGPSSLTSRMLLRVLGGSGFFAGCVLPLLILASAHSQSMSSHLSATISDVRRPVQNANSNMFLYGASLHAERVASRSIVLNGSTSSVVFNASAFSYFQPSRGFDSSKSSSIASRNTLWTFANGRFFRLPKRYKPPASRIPRSTEVTKIRAAQISVDSDPQKPSAVSAGAWKGLKVEIICSSSDRKTESRRDLP